MQYRFSISPIPFNTSLDFNEIIEYSFFFKNRYHLTIDHLMLRNDVFMYHFHKII